MKKSIWIEIKGSIDSRKLWSEIFLYGINLTDTGDKTYVYGNVDSEYIDELISKCKEYGEVVIG